MSTNVDNTVFSPPLFSPGSAGPAVLSGVSVIIPVHNAAMTLEVTLNSVVQQTYAFWEAIIVDDGSTDSTCAIANGWAQRDRRFRVVRQGKAGVSAARNRGLHEARYPYVLFLDGDDRIAPVHLERMVGKLLSDPTLDAVHCGWQNILPSGVAGRAHVGSGEEDLFPHFACDCHFAIHACVLRRELALAVGGFDTSLATCEDWDLFQRVSRSGARFGRVPETLAFYHMRPNSASTDGLRCVTDARVVLDRGHGPDPRLRTTSKAHAHGADPAGRNRSLYYIIIYWAAREIGAGRDGLSLLDVGDLGPAPDLHAGAVAEVIEEGIPVAANCSEKDWPTLWSQVSAPLTAFLAKLEAKACVPRLAFIVLRHMEKTVLLADPSDAPLLFGSSYRVNVNLARQVQDICLPLQVDRVICRLSFNEKKIGVVELPAVGVLAGREIVEVLGENRARLLFRLAMTPTRSVSFGVGLLCALFRLRMFGLMYRVIAGKTEDRLAASKELKQEVTWIAKAKLLRTFAPRPGVAAREARRKWQDIADNATAAGRAWARRALDTQPGIGSHRELRAPLVSTSGCLGSNGANGTGVARHVGIKGNTRSEVPILMYHRIASDGPASLARYRVAPDLFAGQMQALHQAGYRTVRLEKWINALRRNEQLPGKPIILSFDDGYRDFLTAAIPVLRQYVFDATVFLVAERIGGVADWDSVFGGAAPLLSWQEVRTLQETGTEFGCHSAIHWPMTGMSLAELTEDTARARAILVEGLGAPVNSLAYPYGAANEFVRSVVADLGFQAAVTCDPGISRLGDDPLRLRRIEVSGNCTPQQLLAFVGEGSSTGQG